MSIRADGNLNFDTTVDPSGFKKGVNSLEGRVKGFFGNLASAAKLGALTVGAAFAGFAVSAAKVGMEYEAQMSRVKAISGATVDEMKKLDDLALKLGADTSFSAREAAAGMENLASAGFDANETMKAMPGLLDLAAVSGGDVAASSEVAASTLRAFTMDAADAGHVADVFAQAAASTNAEVADMGEAMKYVAPVANAMGISIEETAAAIGIMSDAGIKGSEAGTSLRGALARLAKPSKFAQKVMDDLGLSFYDSEGKMKPLRDQVEMLQDSMAGLTDKEKQNALVTLYGQESLSGMLALIDAGPGKLGALTQSFVTSDGAAKNMAKTMRNNLKGNVDNLMGSLESLQIKLFKSIKGGLNNIVSAVGGTVQKIVSNFDDIQDGLETIFKTLKIIAPMILALYIGTKIIKAVTLLRNAWLTARAAVIAFNISQTLMTTNAAKLSVIQTIIGLITGRITLATVAQMAWNAALAVSPIMWVAAAVGLLITALVGYNEIVSNTETGKETQRLKELDQAARDAADAMDEATAAGQKQAEQSSAEIGYAAQLKDELDGLVDANGKVKKGYENRASFIANELTEATGIEIKLQDGVIKGYDKLTGKIDEYIEKKKAQIWLDANEGAYKDAIKNIDTFTQNYIEKQKALNDAEAAYQKALTDGVSGNEGVAESNRNTALAALQTSQADYEAAQGAITKYEGASADMITGNYGKVIKALGNYGTALADIPNMSQASLQKQKTQLETDLPILAAYYKTHKDKNVKIAIDQKKALLTKTTETLDGMKSTVAAGAPGSKASGVTLGKATIDGIKAGVDDPEKKKGLFSKIIGVMGQLVGEGRKALGIHSPSSVFRKIIGWNIMAGWSLGLTDKAKGLYQTMSSISTKLSAVAPIVDVGYRTPKLPVMSSGTVIPAMATVTAKIRTETNVVMQRMLDKLDGLEMRDIKQTINFNKEIHTPGDAKKALEAMLALGLKVNA